MSSGATRSPQRIGTASIELSDRVVEAQVHRSATGRTTRIQVGRRHPLRVVIPADAAESVAADALAAKSGWIESKLNQMEQAEAETELIGFGAPGTAWIFGERLAVTEGSGRYARREGDVVVVPSTASVRSNALRRWYRRIAGSELRDMVSEEADRLRLSPNGVAVRDQQTRWGSCSAAGRISLNWRLVVAPEQVARYVVIHELCHLRVPNHSRAFWRAVDQACPGWRQESSWLDRHGDELRAFRPN